MKVEMSPPKITREGVLFLCDCGKERIVLHAGKDSVIFRRKNESQEDFPSFEAALQAHKSEEVRAILLKCQSLYAGLLAKAKRDAAWKEARKLYPFAISGEN